jgi:hypothetical protein
MGLIDYVLGDRAGSYLLGSCLLVTALAIIAAILDIPLRTLHEAGYARGRPGRRRMLPAWLVPTFGAVMLLAAFLGAASQVYITSSPNAILVNSLLLYLITNVAFVASVGAWGLSPPLTRHWGLALGAFGFGLAALFLLLAAVLRLPVDASGVVATDPARLLFALTAGGILLALAACLAAIVALLFSDLRGAWLLVTEHSRRTEWLTSDWTAQRRRAAGRQREQTPTSARATEPRSADRGRLGK